MTVKQKPIQRRYRVLDIPHVVDGDTLFIVREWTIGDDGEGTGEILRRDYRGGTRVRLDDGLLGLNAPEEKDDPVGWAQARQDLQDYLTIAKPLGGQFEFVEYALDQWKRPLGNLIPSDSTVVDAVTYQRARGWRSYK